MSHKDAITQFIKKKNPIVLALNSKTTITENLVDFRIACHPFGIFSDASKYSDLGSKLIIPDSILKKTGISLPKNLKTLILGFQ